MHISVCMCVQSVCACTDVSEAEADVGVFLYCSVASPWLLSTQQVKLSTGGDKRRGGQLAGLVLSGQCWAQQRPCSIYCLLPGSMCAEHSLSWQRGCSPDTERSQTHSQPPSEADTELRAEWCMNSELQHTAVRLACDSAQACSRTRPGPGGHGHCGAQGRQPPSEVKVASSQHPFRTKLPFLL